MLCCSLRRECWESEVEGVRGGEDGKLGINCVGSTVMTQDEDSSAGFVLEWVLRSFALARAEPIKASRWRNKDAMEEKWVGKKKKRKIWRASNQSKNKMKRLILEKSVREGKFMCGNGENEGSVWEKDSERVHLPLRVSKTCQENTKSKPLCCKRSRRRLRFFFYLQPTAQ